MDFPFPKGIIYHLFRNERYFGREEEMDDF